MQDSLQIEPEPMSGAPRPHDVFVLFNRFCLPFFLFCLGGDSPSDLDVGRTFGTQYPRLDSDYDLRGAHRPLSAVVEVVVGY